MDKKILLSVQELKEYTGFGEKKIRKILNSPQSNFTIRSGNKLYAHKELFDDYMSRCARYGLTL